MSKPVSPPSPTAVRSPAKLGESARAASLFLDNQLCFSLYATSRAMTKVYRPLLAPMGLTYPQNIVMLALWEHGELTAGGLGDCVALDSGTLVPLVRKPSSAAPQAKIAEDEPMASVAPDKRCKAASGQLRSLDGDVRAGDPDARWRESLAWRCG